MLRVAHRPERSSAIDGLGRNRLHELADLVRDAAQEEEDGDEDHDAREVGGGGDVLCLCVCVCVCVCDERCGGVDVVSNLSAARAFVCVRFYY